VRFREELFFCLVLRFFLIGHGRSLVVLEQQQQQQQRSRSGWKRRRNRDRRHARQRVLWRDGAACQNSGVNGLCQGMVCSACNDPTDDPTCAAAYPPGALCLMGVCTAGDCRVDSDCTPTGQICGASKPNFCGGCKNDAHCQSDAHYGPAFACDTKKNLCVTDACTSNGSACPANGKDFCCALACVAGNCCQDTDCKGTGQACNNHRCTTCPKVTTNTYYVDPMSGDDGAGNGSAATGGACAFKTITAALAALGTAPAAGTKIEILNTAVVGPLETFPIVVPVNVTIGGATAATPTTVDVPAATSGFQLGASPSGLDNLIIDGTKVADYGIVVLGSTALTTSVTNVEIRNMLGVGVLVAANAVLSLGTNVAVHDNGADGLDVRGSLTIKVNTGETAATFDKNGAHGINVGSAGSLTINGSLNPSVTASGNYDAGLLIQQTPGSKLPANLISNFQSLDSKHGNGISIYGGSSLKLRNSLTKGNKYNGIWVTTYTAGSTKNDDVSNIDLGTSGEAGGNTFQPATGSNGESGICLQLTPTAKQKLEAQGNIFGSTD
jgi:hypothetical protein